MHSSEQGLWARPCQVQCPGEEAWQQVFQVALSVRLSFSKDCGGLQGQGLKMSTVASLAGVLLVSFSPWAEIPLRESFLAPSFSGLGDRVEGRKEGRTEGRKGRWKEERKGEREGRREGGREEGKGYLDAVKNTLIWDLDSSKQFTYFLNQKQLCNFLNWARKP